jgi:hypothetical protein
LIDIHNGERHTYPLGKVQYPVDKPHVCGIAQYNEKLYSITIPNDGNCFTIYVANEKEDNLFLRLKHNPHYTCHRVCLFSVFNYNIYIVSKATINSENRYLAEMIHIFDFEGFCIHHKILRDVAKHSYPTISSIRNGYVSIKNVDCCDIYK